MTLFVRTQSLAVRLASSADEPIIIVLAKTAQRCKGGMCAVALIGSFDINNVQHFRFTGFLLFIFLSRINDKHILVYVV